MKAKLVFDMPSNCDDCPLAKYFSKFMVWYCGATTNSRELSEISDKPEWCPLEPIEDFEE